MPSLVRRSDISGDLGERRDFVPHRRHDRLRRSGRRREAVPRREFETRQRLGDRRDVGRSRESAARVPTTSSLILSLLMCGSSADALPK